VKIRKESNHLDVIGKEKPMAKKRKSSHSKGNGKIYKVMKEFKEGELESSSGKKVKSREQAVAIALSEARAAGERIPKKKAKTKRKKRKKS